MNEVRIFIADSIKADDSFDKNSVEDVMNYAEEEGTVYSLSGFCKEFNNMSMGKVMKICLMSDGKFVKEITDFQELVEPQTTKIYKVFDDSLIDDVMGSQELKEHLYGIIRTVEDKKEIGKRIKETFSEDFNECIHMADLFLIMYDSKRIPEGMTDEETIKLLQLFDIDVEEIIVR